MQLADITSTFVGTISALTPSAVFGSCDALSFTAPSSARRPEVPPPPFRPPMPYSRENDFRTAVRTLPPQFGPLLLYFPIIGFCDSSAVPSFRGRGTPYRDHQLAL